jgi:SAM-dependent methyltransferase
MHPEAKDFTLFVKKILPDFFINKTVLDVGSGDINGNNRFLFENCEYNGNDVIEANNVTIVSKTKDLPFKDNTFDTIISTECFEHDPEYKESFIKIYSMLKPNGLFCFTCASTNRPEHGTLRTTPNDSYGTIGNLENMSNYYKNITESDLNEILKLNDLFSIWDTYYNYISKDLYFVGIKKNYFTLNILEKYINVGVINTSLYINNPEIYKMQNIPNIPNKKFNNKQKKNNKKLKNRYHKIHKKLIRKKLIRKKLIHKKLIRKK